MRIERSNWEQRTLGEFFDLQMGKTPSRKDLSLWEDGDTPWVSISDMKESRYISDTKEHLPYQTIAECRIPIIPVGTVIMSFKLTIGKTCIVSKPLTTNEAIMAFYPKKGIEVNSSFLAYALSALKWKGNRAVKGVTINKKTISEKNFSLPPIGLQDNIAAELDAIQEVIDGYKDQIADLDALAQSIFLNTFGDPISNPKGWEMKPIKELTIKMSTGPFGSMLHKEDYSADGIPSINPQDIKGNQFSNANIARVNIVKAKELRKYVLDVNDVVIARRGDLCKCAVIREEQKGWLCGTGSFFLTLLDYNPTLFFYCYTSRSIQKYLNDKCIGATMPNLNQGILSSLKLPVPPIELQQRFANKIASIEQQKDLLRQQLADAEMLMAERMQYYFS